MNLTLAEQPNGDFGQTIVRQWLIDAWQLELYEGLRRLLRRAPGRDRRQGAQGDALPPPLQQRLAGAPRGWHGGEPPARAGARSMTLWRFTAELFAADEVDERMSRAGIAPALAPLAPGWSARIEEDLRRRRLSRPAAAALSLARQARRAHRAPRAPAGRDAAPAAHLSRGALVMTRAPRGAGERPRRHARRASGRSSATCPILRSRC